MPTPDRGAAPDPVALHAHAVEQLAYIRSTMTRASAFTAVPGLGGMLMGVSAFVAGWFARGPSTDGTFLRVWITEAAVAVAIALAAMHVKSRAAGVPLLAAPGRQFAASFAPPIVAAMLLTPMLVRAGMVSLLPATWLTLYGTAFVTGGAFSVRVVPIMGLAFMALGTAAAAWPGPSNAWMMLGFGGLHMVFGLWIARRHGG